MAQTPEQRRDSAKRARLMLLYHITPEEQDLVENFQREDPTLRVLLTKGNPNEPANLFTDHSHVTGLFRGRLAYLINKGLGVIEGTYKERTSAVLRALAEYLDYPPSLRKGIERYGLLGRAKKKRKMIYGKAGQ
jgi:Recombination endonuclease VII